MENQTSQTSGNKLDTATKLNIVLLTVVFGITTLFVVDSRKSKLEKDELKSELKLAEDNAANYKDSLSTMWKDYYFVNKEDWRTIQLAKGSIISTDSIK